MRPIVTKIIAVIFTASIFISCLSNNNQKQVTKEDYEKATVHMDRGLYNLVHNQVKTNNWSGEKILLYSINTEEGKEFIMVNTKTKEKKAAFNHQKLASALTTLTGSEIKGTNLPISSLQISENQEDLSFAIGAINYTCNLSDYTLQVKEGKKEKRNRLEHLSPNGKLAAYIQNYNLWVRNTTTNKRTQLTFDGKKDYGYATNNAGWIKGDNAVLKWSPNSDKIATFQQDARGVGEMYLVSTKVGHPTLQAWKHPLPGDETIFTIERVIIHLGARPKVVRLKMKKDFQRGSTTDHIAGWTGVLLDAQWKADGSEFAFVSGSRDHKIAHLQIANTKTGAVKSIHKEEVETYYESGARGENWKVLFDSNEFIWFSEKTDWGHLYLYDLKTKKLKNQITTGKWAVQRIYDVDEDNREILFSAGGKEEGNPYHRYLYKVAFDGTNLSNISPDKGAHTFRFSPSKDYFIDTYSTITTPPVSVLRSRNGEKIADLASADISGLKAKGWQEPIEFNVKARDNKTDIYGLLFKPSHYNESDSYPVLNYIYPGPQSGSVGNYSFRPVWRDFQAVAELGFVVVAVDAMGTPGRSKSFHDFYYGNMGDNGIPDNMAAIKQLANTYKGMDLERVGIWGHSGGGFASTRALFAYPDFYDVAVSGSGNHDNRNYEADWGEKWQGLLQNGNIEGQLDGTTNYDNQANQLLAENLKGKLLITHGSMDDNVPPSNTMLVVEALIKANKDFDMIIFPNKRHGYGDMTNYMTRKRWDYFVTHLLKTTPPKEFVIK